VHKKRAKKINLKWWCCTHWKNFKGCFWGKSTATSPP